MLLLVVRAEFDDIGERDVRGTVEHVEHRLVDVGPVVGHLRERRPRDETTVGTGMARPDGVVVAVEQEPVLRPVPHPSARAVGAEHELGEEPGGVGAVPFRRARVGHRLHQLVLDRQRRGETLGPGADFDVTLLEPADLHVEIQPGVDHSCSGTQGNIP